MAVKWRYDFKKGPKIYAYLTFLVWWDRTAFWDRLRVGTCLYHFFRKLAWEFKCEGYAGTKCCYNTPISTASDSPIISGRGECDEDDEVQVETAYRCSDWRTYAQWAVNRLPRAKTEGRKEISIMGMFVAYQEMSAIRIFYFSIYCTYWIAYPQPNRLNTQLVPLTKTSCVQKSLIICTKI